MADDKEKFKVLAQKLGSIRDTVVRTRNYDKAIRELNKLSALYPTYVDIMRLKGNVLDLKASEMSYLSGDKTGDVVYDEALACYDHILSLDPQNTLAYIDRAGYWLRKKEYITALRDCDKAIDILKSGGFYLSWKEEVEEAYSCKIEILEELGNESEVEAVKIEMQQQLDS